MFAPLKDVMAMYEKEKVPSLAFKTDGEFELILREPDGAVAGHLKQHNATTEWFRWAWSKANSSWANGNHAYGGLAIWENTTALNAWSFSGRYFMPGTFYVGVTNTYTPSTKTWLIQGVFGAGTTRTFQTVAWMANPLSSYYFGNGRAFGNISAYTVLSQPVTQLSTQTLEVNYRITYTR